MRKIPEKDKAIRNKTIPLREDQIKYLESMKYGTQAPFVRDAIDKAIMRKDAITKR